MELIAWFLILPIFIYIGLRKNQFVPRLTSLLLVISLGFVISNIASFSIEEFKASEPEPIPSPFVFHKKNNKILIVLDTLQSDIFLEIMQTYPGELDFLTGFKFYPNTLGGYPTTIASVPLIISGKFYRNRSSIADWSKKEVFGQTIIDFYAGKNYGTSVVLNDVPSRGLLKRPAISMATVQHSGWRREIADLVPVIDAGLFRASPTRLKPRIYDQGNWLLTRLFGAAEDPPGHHGADSSFVRALLSNISVDSSKSGEFKYYHLRGAHFPLQVNERFEYQPDMPVTRESFVLQTRGVFKNVHEIIGALKAKSIYESSDILIIGDHGSIPIALIDINDRDFNSRDIEARVLSSSRPVFLYKPALSKGALSISDAPLHIGDTACILSGWQKFCEENINNMADIESRDSRKFYYYKWGHEYWKKETLPPIWNYIVSGDVRDINSWSLGPESLEPITCNRPIDFKKKKTDISNPKASTPTIEPYYAYGLAPQEGFGRKSTGHKVLIRFNFSTKHCIPKLIEIHSRVFAEVENPTIPPSVFLNGTHIGQMTSGRNWGGTQISTLHIPEKAGINNGLNSLELKSSNPRTSNNTGMRRPGLDLDRIDFK